MKMICPKAKESTRKCYCKKRQPHESVVGEAGEPFPTCPTCIPVPDQPDQLTGCPDNGGNCNVRNAEDCQTCKFNGEQSIRQPEPACTPVPDQPDILTDEERLIVQEEYYKNLIKDYQAQLSKCGDRERIYPILEELVQGKMRYEDAASQIISTLRTEDEVRAEVYKEIGIARNRAEAGLKALPFPNESEYWKGYWSGQIDLCNDLLTVEQGKSPESEVSV